MNRTMTSTLQQTLLSSALSDSLSQLYERVRPSVVLVYRYSGNGAGVIWREDGLIVTNNHVVSADGQARIVMADGRNVTAIVAARHPTRDLALLKVAVDNLPSIEIADSSKVRPGQLVAAIGHPLGYRDAITAGIVVAAGQAATGEGPRTGDFIQVDAQLAPGNSGGPLVDVDGRVLGINSMVAGRLGMSIPSLAVQHFVEGDRPGGSIAYIGVNGIVVGLRNLPQEQGFLLTDVAEGTPAARAGLIVGDVILAIGDKPITDRESVPAAMLRLRPGEAVSFDVLRGGEPRQFVVVPTERAESAGSTP
jgi:serine protease Do